MAAAQCKAYRNNYFFMHNSALRPIVMKQCNGTISAPFGKAWIERIRTSQPGVLFANLFNEASACFLDMMLGLEKGSGDESRPDVTALDDKKKAALDCIKKYLTEDFEKHEKCILKLSEVDCEVKVQAILAVHLFAPLIPDIPGAEKYGIDKHHFPKDEQSRKCPSCGERLKFMDTSFGNNDIWHGYADIILKKCAVTVNKEYDLTRRPTRQRAENYDSDSDASVSSHATSSSISSISSVEVKWYEKSDDFSKQEEAEAQAIAQTITNAFCEESNRDKLIPSFLASNEKVKIYMYCCSKDILLESTYLPICSDGSLSIKALVLVWLAVNFDFFQVVDLFSDKYKDKLKYKWPQSNFHKIVGEDVLRLYQCEAGRHVIRKKSKKMEESDIIDVPPQLYNFSVEGEVLDMNQLGEKISLMFEQNTMLSKGQLDN